SRPPSVGGLTRVAMQPWPKVVTEVTSGVKTRDKPARRAVRLREDNVRGLRVEGELSPVTEGDRRVMRVAVRSKPEQMFGATGRGSGAIRGLFYASSGPSRRSSRDLSESSVVQERLIPRYRRAP